MLNGKYYIKGFSKKGNTLFQNVIKIENRILLHIPSVTSSLV